MYTLYIYFTSSEGLHGLKAKITIIVRT